MFLFHSQASIILRQSNTVCLVVPSPALRLEYDLDFCSLSLLRYVTSVAYRTRLRLFSQSLQDVPKRASDCVRGLPQC